MKEKKTLELTHVEHTFEPVYDNDSRILILGTLPSVKSRENNFYYGHPRNRFWQLIAVLTGSSVPTTIEEKKRMLLDNGIAILDVVQSCDIHASSDSSITNVIPADIKKVLSNSNIKKIYANGGAAYDLYNKYCFENTGVEIIKLPSTSPANAAYSLDKLKKHWFVILEQIRS